MDTAVVLRCVPDNWALRNLTRTMRACAALAREHAATPMPGRTWLQHASPTTFGLKAAGWLDMLGRCRDRIRIRSIAQVVQLGGAAAPWRRLARTAPPSRTPWPELGFAVPAMPWHTHRDRIVEVAAAFGIACGALGKIGRDLTLLAQSEVAEAFEEPASGGSSSMPHKQNPVRAVTAVAAAIRAPGLVATMLAAMPQEHERAAGGWQAEWETLADLMSHPEAAGAIAVALGNLRWIRRPCAKSGLTAVWPWPKRWHRTDGAPGPDRRDGPRRAAFARGGTRGCRSLRELASATRSVAMVVARGDRPGTRS